MNAKQIDPDKELPVMEAFYTLQGEGSHSGKAAYFIRLAGCDVGCVWCDVKESWDANKHPIQSIDKIVEEASNYPARFVVITGGEPLMYNLSALTQLLRENGFTIAVETSGCYHLQGKIDWYCFSPKKFKKPVESSYEIANELKVIIAHPSDFEWAEGHAKKVNENCQLFLQPEWDKRERFLPMIVDYVKNNPQWRISLQTHKYLNIP
ncbi:MAG: 7-carboxy-7-deazaguanine synthase QueE [Bacteroidetes bacterium]|nr:MAG: 7-carboxy-7-deazaguanine synthase QueE [Bacteroidota bacterium]